MICKYISNVTDILTHFTLDEKNELTRKFFLLCDQLSERLEIHCSGASTGFYLFLSYHLINCQNLSH